MPAVSQKQQKFFGYLDSHPKEAKKRGIDMTHEQIRDFAATKRAGLPESAPKMKYRRRSER